MTNHLFRNLDYGARETVLQKLKRKQKRRKKLAMFESLALTDPTGDVQISQLPYAPAEPAPCGMLDGIYPQEDRESKPISSLDYGILETHMADDGASENEAKPIRALKIGMVELRDFLRHKVIPYVDPMYRQFIQVDLDELPAWAFECAMVERGERQIKDLGGLEDFLLNMKDKIVPILAKDDKLSVFDMDKRLDVIIGAALKELNKLA